MRFCSNIVKIYAEVLQSHRFPGVETAIIIIGVHVHRVFLVLGLVVLYSISPAER